MYALRCKEKLEAGRILQAGVGGILAARIENFEKIYR